ncbi:MAG: 3-isopropylmalate dehydrogenase [Phycisphaerae bacterium]|nr:3-isopropylmalate dehydrogenase [Phycisphaerae bacterium]
MGSGGRPRCLVLQGADVVLKIAVIGGDGTGPEVVREGLKVLKEVAAKENFQYTTTDYDLSGKAYLARGGDPNKQNIPIVTDEQIAELRKYDAIYLGAVGDPDIVPGILELGLLLRLRFELDQYINLRPVKLYPGVETPLRDKGPEHINFDVVRENTEDLYFGGGGFLRKNTPNEVATQEMIATRFGVERCLRYAFEFCRKKNQKRMLTLVAKRNVLTYAHDLWWRAFNEIGDRDYPDIKRDYNHVDACCMWFVKNPEFYDTIVVSNMFGDIITDLGAMIQGGMGVAAGGNINPQGVSMFEPIGGSAPKYTGMNVINPIAAIAALAMLLRVVGAQKGDAAVERAGNRVEKAIMATCPKMKSQSAGKMGYSTTQVGDLVCQAL